MKGVLYDRDDDAITAAALAIARRLQFDIDPASAEPVLNKAKKAKTSPRQRIIKKRRRNEIILGLNAAAERGRKLVNAFEKLHDDYRSAYLAELFASASRMPQPVGHRGMVQEAVRLIREYTGFNAEQIKGGMTVYASTNINIRNGETSRVEFWARVGRALNAPASASRIAQEGWLTPAANFFGVAVETSGHDAHPRGRSGEGPKAVVASKNAHTM